MPPKIAKATKKTQNPALQEEFLAIKLLYCVQSRPKEQQKRVKENIEQTLKTAIFRVISTVEKALQEKGYFKDSVSILQDYRSVVQLLIQKTDIVIIRQFLHQYYEKGLSSFEDKKIIAFYSCLVETIQKSKVKDLRMEIQCCNLDEDQPQQQKEAEKQPSVEQKGFSVQQKQKINSIVEISEDPIVQVAQLPQTQLSEESKTFIRDFTAGWKPLQKGKHKVVKRLKMPCLKPGQPFQSWQYYDSLQGGVVKLTFNSIKQE